MTQQITFAELCENPLYRKWIVQPPTKLLEDPYVRKWRVWVQKVEGGPWGYREFKSWRKATKWAIKIRTKVWDLAINCPARPTRVPLVKTKRITSKGLAIREPWALPAGHLWCDYCRRPTVFKYFKSHHVCRLGSHRIPTIPYIRMCTVCGVKEDFLLRTRRGSS